MIEIQRPALGHEVMDDGGTTAQQRNEGRRYLDCWRAQQGIGELEPQILELEFAPAGGH